MSNDKQATRVQMAEKQNHYSNYYYSIYGEK